MKTFLSLWLQSSCNSNLAGYTVNNPRAISIKEMQEEKIQLRHAGKEIKTSERYWSKGPTEKKTLCSITLGQSITAATGRWALALGIKDVSNLELLISAHMAEHSQWNLLEGYPPLSNKLIMVVLFSSMSAAIKTWVHKQSNLHHYQEHESWPSKRRLKTGNTKAWYELCQEERQAASEPACKSHISSIMFPWKDQICI